MTATLHPMNLGEILDRTFQIYRSRFLVFVGIAAFPSVAMRCVYIADILWFHSQSLIHTFRQPANMMGNFLIGLGFYHIASLLGLMIAPAHIKLASSSILEENSSLAYALRFAVARWRGYLWIAILKLSADLLGPEMVLAGLAFGIGVIEQVTGLLDSGANWPFVLLFTVPAVIGIYLFLRIGACLSLVMPAGALENLSAPAALRRSWTLSRGSRLRIMFTWLALFISSWIAAYLAQILLWELMYPIGLWLHRMALVRQLYLPIAYAMLTIIHTLLGPIYPIASTLFYYDQRMRREGYDIEKLMDAAGLNALAPSTALAENGPVVSTESAEALP
jgi:hypothetical protein